MNKLLIDLLPPGDEMCELWLPDTSFLLTGDSVLILGGVVIFFATGSGSVLVTCLLALGVVCFPGFGAATAALGRVFIISSKPSSSIVGIFIDLACRYGQLKNVSTNNFK
jgi:hypothetical protein